MHFYYKFYLQDFNFLNLFRNEIFLNTNERKFEYLNLGLKSQNALSLPFHSLSTDFGEEKLFSKGGILFFPTSTHIPYANEKNPD